MTLHGPDGNTDRRSGDWSVVESRGSRWLVEFVCEDPRQTIQLRIVFNEADGFTAREVSGDDRVGAWVFRRQSGTGDGVTGGG